MTNNNVSILVTFAQRVSDLTPEAWERIAARCDKLEHRSLEGFLGRAELVGRVFTLDADPYRQPLVLSALGAWGTLWGLAMEGLHLLNVAPPKATSAAGGVIPQPQADALDRVVAAADRQRRDHPGAAAACHVIGLVLLRSQVAAANIASLYAPFEPEIPFASLGADPEQHAA